MTHATRTTMTRLGALLAIMLMTLAVTLAACKGQPAGGPDSTSTPIDAETMAFLSAARSQHHKADIREDSGDVAGAIGEMEYLVKMRLPHPGVRVVEIEEVLADAFARLAELRLRQGDIEGGLRTVRAGLEHAGDPTYFRGHLLEVEGILEKARAASLAAAGQREESEKAKQHAIELLHESVQVQEQVIGKSLGADVNDNDAGARK